jgi:hypothetical protein
LKFSLCLLIFLLGIDFHFVNKDEKMPTRTVTTNAGVQMLRLIYGTAWKKKKKQHNFWLKKYLIDFVVLTERVNQNIIGR